MNPIQKMMPLRIPDRYRRNLLLPLRDKVVKALFRLKQIPKWVRDAILLSILSRFVTYASIFINWAFPAWANSKIDFFLCPDYKNPMYVTWWVYYFSEDLSWLLASYVFCKIASRISDCLFLVGVIFMGYHLFDILMYIWNFKQYSLIYVDIFWTILTLIWTVFKGYKLETIAKIRSLF
jgi:hypothetical protein